jgi:hypothetical protein
VSDTDPLAIVPAGCLAAAGDACGLYVTGAKRGRPPNQETWSILTMGNLLHMAIATTLCVVAFASGVAAQSRIVAPDSSVSIRLPASFIPAPLHDDAVLQFADTASESYVLVLLESREDLVGWNLARHSMVTAAQIVGGLDMPEVVGPEVIEIGAVQAVQYEMRGALQGTGVAYLHTSLESPHAFAQVLAWTAGAQWGANESQLREITSSVEIHASPGSVPVDIMSLVGNTWAWERGDDSCTGPKQRFEVSTDGKAMKIHHSEPIEGMDGSTTSVTNYVIDSATKSTLSTYIPEETRVDANGSPVRWNLVLVGRNRMAWHRADWPEDSLTGMLRPCPL